MPQKKPAKKKTGKPMSLVAYIVTFGALISSILILLKRFKGSHPTKSGDLRQDSQLNMPKIYPETTTTLPAQRDEPSPIADTDGPISNASEAKIEFTTDSEIEQTSSETLATTNVVRGTTWSKTTKYIVAVGLVLAFLLIVLLVHSAIPIIIFAAILAFIVQPLIRFINQRLHMSRNLATVVTYLIVVVVIITIPLIIIPAMINAINFILTIDFQTLINGITRAVDSAAAWVENIPILGFLFGPGLDAFAQTLRDLPTMTTPEQVSIDASVASLGSRLAMTMGLLVNVFGPLVSALLALVFMIMISLHLSLSGRELFGNLSELIPAAYNPEIFGLLDRIGKIWSAFLRGQLTLMLVIGTMVWLGNLILGTPQAFFLGITSGLLEVIPSLGPLLAAIPAVLLALIFGSTHFAINHLLFALIVILFYTLIQVLENQLVVPKVLGEAVDLPPLVVLLGVFVGGGLFGILGVFLATPVISSGREIFIYLYNKILERKEVEIEPQIEKPSFMDTIKGFARRIRKPFS